MSRGSSCDIRPPPWWPVGNYLKSENFEPRKAPPRQAVLREEAPNYGGVSESLHSVSFWCLEPGTPQALDAVGVPTCSSAG